MNDADGAAMFEDVREQLRTAKERVRTYGQELGVDAAFVEPVVAAVGDISVDEAFDALEREAVAERERVRQEGRRALDAGRSARTDQRVKT
jgi:hypothetical protein